MTTTYDYVVPRYHADGIAKVLLTQWAVSSEWLKEPLPAQDCRYSVSFIGTANPERSEFVAQLSSRGIDVSCFGYGWPSGPLDSEAIPGIMRDSIISLNFANSKGENQIKARTFEVCGAGGFLLTNPAKGLERFYVPGKEIAIYEDFEDLVRKINHYLSKLGERDLIAQSGYQRTVREHTYEQRLKEVIDYALAAKAHARVMKPKLSFNHALKAHKLTPLLRMLRFTLVLSGKMLFGPVRGPRAARRLMFEFSWRAMGRKTFTASSWPGRMFPHE